MISLSFISNFSFSSDYYIFDGIYGPIPNEYGSVDLSDYAMNLNFLKYLK